MRSGSFIEETTADLLLRIHHFISTFNNKTSKTERNVQCGEYCDPSGAGDLIMREANGSVTLSITFLTELDRVNNKYWVSGITFVVSSGSV